MIDLFIDRQLSDEETQEILSNVFKIGTQEILIVREANWPERLSDNIQLVCVLHNTGGEFPLTISLYLQDYRLDDLNDEKLTMQICHEGHCRALIGDNSVNPYTWILIDSSGKKIPVLIDSETKEINILRILDDL